MPKSPTKPREELCADKMHLLLRSHFEHLRDGRQGDVLPVADALMSGFAVFSLKYPSLLAFEQRPEDNLRSLYRIREIPSDTHMRRMLDGVDPASLRSAFCAIFQEVQRGGTLKKMSFLDHYLVSLDGTEYFTSEKVYCDQCLTKKHKNGALTYHHQMLGAAIVHPDHREVIPLCPEPIVMQDGRKKNDCERNAGKRWLEQCRKDHPHLPVIIIEDALSSNAPHITELQKHNCRFILGIKEAGNAYAFEHLQSGERNGATTVIERARADGTKKRFRFRNDVPLNMANINTIVNVLEYWEERRGHKGRTEKLHFAWVTDFEITEQSCEEIMRGGRARWRIENETFNTLKNQGYHFEHNFGHGEKNLSTNFALLMMLAFLVDQVQQLACTIFQRAWATAGSKRELWERLRALVRYFIWDCMADVFRAIADGVVRFRLTPAPP